ncbi:MAG TPA: rod shape-determining protein RodA [Flavisolibacter sp.]|nr:rod shape-determining protein RodA [Flavisolibacter sp.]
MSRNTTGISKGVDWSLVWLYLLLAFIGVMAIFGATYREGDPVVASFLSFKTDYSKQFFYFLIAAVIGIFILVTDSKFFTATANLWYFIGIFFMLLVFPFHSRVKGTESIIKFGGFQFQPAEFCKIVVCLALAKYLSLPDQNFKKTKAQLIATGLALLPAVLAQMQHETGLALVYFSFFIVMYREGLSPMVLIIGFSVAALIVATIVMNPNTLAVLLTIIAVLAILFLRRQIKRKKSLLLSIVFLWFVCVGFQRFAVPFMFQHVFKTYQTERIFSLFGKDNPYGVQTGDDVEDIIAKKKEKESKDYNVRQSKIAIGSGGLIGKGLLKGTQTRYSFVPEQRTDFIFCTIGEGFGFTGTFLVLGIYLILLFRIVTVAERQRSVFSRCYAYGVASVLFFHIVINVCMTIGLAPVIGITLPLISYGGTSVITFTILIFILIRLDADRQMVLR